MTITTEQFKKIRDSLLADAKASLTEKDGDNPTIEMIYDSTGGLWFYINPDNETDTMRNELREITDSCKSEHLREQLVEIGFDMIRDLDLHSEYKFEIEDKLNEAK